MVKFQRRLSPQAIDVLEFLSSQGGNWRYGLEISAATGLKSGSLYPLLARLLDRGFVKGEWLGPERPGRPARHGYQITAAGRSALIEASQGAPGLREALS